MKYRIIGRYGINDYGEKYLEWICYDRLLMMPLWSRWIIVESSQQ